MKQFSLKEYLKNPSREVVTRDGRKVKRVLCTDVKGKYPIVVVIENHDGNTERAISLTKDGKYLDSGSDSKDLFFGPEKHEGWIDIYKNIVNDRVPSMMVYKTKEEAIKNIFNQDCYIDTIKIEWEE